MNNQQMLPTGAVVNRIYLQRHPDQINRIFEYMMSHDLAKAENAFSLRGVLDGDVEAALADGWL